ncbi:MAG: DUF927 domain-containing protein [Oscillospiraceae bacterium]|nr:DUF927 domain-containing protein [Oscillospiraceae bacterium]
MSWYRKDGKIWVDMVGKNLPQDFKPFCDDFYITRKNVNLHDGSENIDVVIYKPYAPKPFNLERQNLTAVKVLGKFLAQGLDIIDSDSNAKGLLALIIEMENSAAVQFFHEKTGFTTLNSGETCFLGSNPIGLDGIKAQSILIKDDGMKPAGSKGAFRRLLLSEVAKRSELCIALSLAVTAPVAHMLKEAGVFMDLPIWVLVGHSSIGKSSSHYLQLALFMNPMKGLRTFNSTENAFYAMQATQNGVPFIGDDASNIPGFSVDSLLYTLPTGRKKSRCNSDGSLKPQVTFSGATIMSSEKSLLDRSSENAGEYARVVEFCLRWTKDDKQADKIKEVCSKNYGWGTEPIISLLMSEGFDKKLIRKFKKTYEQLREEKKPVNGVEARLLQRKALILVSLWVAEKALKIGLHPEKVKPILDEVFEENLQGTSVEVSDETDELMDYLLSEISKNGSKFRNETDLSSSKYDITTSDLWGTKGFDGNDKTLWVLRTKFEEMIKKSKFGPKTAIKMLASKNFIKAYSKNHYLYERDVGFGKQKGYVLMLPKAQTALQEIFDMNKVNSIVDIEKRLLNDDLGIKSSYHEKIKKFTEKKDEPLLALGFIRLGAQNLVLVLNKSLIKELEINVSDGFYIAPIPAKNALLLSKKELTNDCLKMSLHKSKKHTWCSNERKKEAILEVLGIELPVRYRVAFTDIVVERDAYGIPCAMVNAMNDFCTFAGEINSVEPYEIDDLYDPEANLLGELPENIKLERRTL